MDISRQAISKWETGKSYPDIEKILKLSDISVKSRKKAAKACPSKKGRLYVFLQPGYHSVKSAL